MSGSRGLKSASRYGGMFRRSSPDLAKARSTDSSPIKAYRGSVERADTVTKNWPGPQVYPANPVAGIRSSLYGFSISRLTRDTPRVSPLPNLRSKVVCLFDQFPIQPLSRNYGTERNRRIRQPVGSVQIAGRLRGLLGDPGSSTKSLVSSSMTVSGSPAKRTSKRQL